MKKHLIIALIAFLITASQVFSQGRETRDVGSFTKVEFKIPGKLYIKQGGSDKLEIEGPKKALSEIETRVEGSKLVISLPGRWNWDDDGRDMEDVKVYVTVKQLEALGAAGSGDVIGEGKFNTGDIALRVSGSGSLELNVESSGELLANVSGSGNLMVEGRAKRFDSSVSGSGKVGMRLDVAGKSDFSISGFGKIEAAGKTDDVEISISGSGKVLAANLETNRCEVKISGSGSVEINVKEELDSHISGSGTVSYKGNPSRINNNASGSGTLRKM